LDALAQVPLLKDLSHRELRRVLDAAEEYEYPADTMMAKEESAGDAFFVILEGQARVIRRGKIVAVLWPGDFFGEISVLDGGPRTATVVAETDVRCLLVLGQEFRKLLSADPRIASKLLRETARRLRRMDHPLQG
jgi:CRP-like cAMP-binding protein